MNSDEILNNIIEEEEPKKIHRKGSHALRIMLTILIIALCIIILWHYSSDTEQVAPVIDGYEKHLAQINGQDAIVFEHTDGTYSARVNYAYCEPLSFVDDCRWDRENINIIWER